MAPSGESPALAGLREQAQAAARRLSAANREIRETEDAGGVASDGLLARRDEYRRQLDALKHQIDLEKGLFGQVAAGDNSNAFDAAPAQVDPNLDTGHYDDGHSFGWKGGAPPDPYSLKQLDAKIDDAKIEYDSAVDHLTHVADLVKINQTTPGQMDEASSRMEAARKALDDLRDERDTLAKQTQTQTSGPSDAGTDLDTGHYDDGHSFGWKKPEPAPNKWKDLTAGTDLSPEPPTPPSDSTTGLNWKVAVGGVLALALIAVVAVVALAGGGGSSSKTDTVAPPSTVDDAPAATAPVATTPAVANKPINYQSNCNGACFMKVDPASCDRTFHFDITLVGDVARFEGKTAVISTAGPGWQPTYNVAVAGGKVVQDAVVPGSAYGGDPARACGPKDATAHWAALLTSVDGHPTVTPDPPT
jgi:hypothetical protein